MPRLTGADALVAALAGAGVDVCFTNPGTTELHLVESLNGAPGVRSVLALFEGVATGAADGYGRVTGRPAMTLLHLGPGLGNGIANLHNAAKARTPVVNVVGAHTTWHETLDSPLACDIAGLASSVSRWVSTVPNAAAMVDEARSAVEAAFGPPGGVATLIVPADCQWDAAPSADRESARWPEPRWAIAADDEVAEAAGALSAQATAVLYLGGRALRARGLRAAARVQAATGCAVWTETFAARLERGSGVPSFRPLPYFAEHASAALADATHLVLAGAPTPVSTFGSRTTTSLLAPTSCTEVTLAGVDADAEAALEALADALGAPAAGPPPDRPSAEVPHGCGLDPIRAAETLSALLPEDTIVVDEGATSSYAFSARMPRALPHTTYALTGGAIGMGMPFAVGAAVAAGGRRTVVIQADGSAMYTPQSLWTMARESLDVTVLLLANHRYEILRTELGRMGVDDLGATEDALTSLTDPRIDWVSLAAGLGVPAERVDSVDDLAAALGRSLATAGPSLIEATI